MKLAIVLIGALLAGAFQCAAGCASIAPDAPCHHNQQSPSPAACSHELVLQRGQAPAHDYAAPPAILTAGFAEPTLGPPERRENPIERSLWSDRPPSPPLRL